MGNHSIQGSGEQLGALPVSLRRLSQWYSIYLGLAAARSFSGVPYRWWSSSHLRSPRVEGSPQLPLRRSHIHLSLRHQEPR